MELLGDLGHVESHFCPFGDSVGARWVHGLEIVLLLMQDKCTVCAEHTTGSEIILDAPDGTPR
jgi:hypothetical protein